MAREHPQISTVSSHAPMLLFRFLPLEVSASFVLPGCFVAASCQKNMREFGEHGNREKSSKNSRNPIECFFD